MIEYFKNLYLASPTVTYCERATGGLIEQPFNAFGNIVFIFVGALILLNGKKNALSKSFGWTVILVGVFSFVYDSSHSFLFQVIDFLGMFIFVTLLLFLNFKNLELNISKTYRWLVVVLGVFIFLAFSRLSAHVIFGILVLAIIISEFFIKKQISRKNWYIGVTSFFIGVIFWLADLNRIYCDPTKIFNGRNLEHFFFAIAIYFLYLYYSRRSNKNID